MRATAVDDVTVRRGIRRGRLARKGLFYVALGVVCVVALFPIYWMINCALQAPRNILTFPPSVFPLEPTFKAFVQMFDRYAVASWLAHSALLATLATIIVLTLTVAGGYTLSAFAWRGKGLFGFLLLFTQMMPEALIVIPVYALYRRFSMLDSVPYLALIDAAFVLPVGIWILKNQFDNIPRDLYDAAIADGCSPLGVLRWVFLPIVTPGLVAVGVVAFFYAWNEYLFAVTLVTDRDVWTASVGLAAMPNMSGYPIDQMFAAGLVFSVLPVVFYLAVQRHIVAGLTAGAVKG
jgi:multiple sugar transport system permease protein